MTCVDRGAQRQWISPYRRRAGEHDLPDALSHYVGTALESLRSIHLIDNVNFNGQVFPHAIDPRSVLGLYPLEPGYTTLDASFEMGSVIRHLEATRLAIAEPGRAKTFQRWMALAGVGVSNSGCTGAIHQVVTALLDLPREKFPRQNLAPEIVVPLPCYSVFPIQMGHFHGRVKPSWVVSRREDDFMPRFADIRAAVNDRTIAIMLPYPANPSMATYEGARLDDLRSTIRFCQENGIFLIADNIFQDMLFPASERRFEEVFLHAEGIEGIVKIYGPSKDVPFFGGYRMGYWIGDPRLMKGFRAAAGVSNTGVNTLSLILFAFHLYFRSLRISNRQPALDDMGFFADTVFGCTSIMNKIREAASHRKLFDAQSLFARLVQLDLYGKYQRDMARTEQLLGEALRRLKRFATASAAFSDWYLP